MDLGNKEPAETNVAASNGYVERAGMGFREFILLIAALSSIVALSIDIMLPVLPQIGDSYAVAAANDRQAVIVVFMLGFGLAQIVFGPLSDRFGRNAVLIPAALFYALSSIAAAFAESFALLLFLRACQGIGAAAVRIIVNAIVRDCFGGREMARVMSYTFMVFMIVPIIAPTLGHWIAWASSWQWIFILLGMAGFVFAGWTAVRLRETLRREDRLPFSTTAIFDAFAEVVTSRQAMGYALGATLCIGSLFAFIVSSQQIFDVIYGLGDWFPYAFAAVAGLMAVVSFANGTLVRRLGMRWISHGALIAFTVVAGVFLVVALSGQPPFWLAFLLIAVNVGTFAVVAPNFNAIAMEPLGHIAGTASSVLGVITFTGGAVLGGIVGRAFDGTLIPVAAAFTLFGCTALAIVLWTERGRLFARHPG